MTERFQAYEQKKHMTLINRTMNLVPSFTPVTNHPRTRAPVKQTSGSPSKSKHALTKSMDLGDCPIPLFISLHIANEAKKNHSPVKGRGSGIAKARGQAPGRELRASQSRTSIDAHPQTAAKWVKQGMQMTLPSRDTAKTTEHIRVDDIKRMLVTHTDSNSSDRGTAPESANQSLLWKKYLA